MKAYKEPDGITCLAGDMPPQIDIRVTDADGIAGLTVRAIVVSVKNPDRIVLSKNAAAADGGFVVQFTTAETAGLAGDYLIDLIVLDAQEQQYKKVRIPFTVMRSARGGLGNGG